MNDIKFRMKKRVGRKRREEKERGKKKKAVRRLGEIKNLENERERYGEKEEEK